MDRRSKGTESPIRKDGQEEEHHAKWGSKETAVRA